MTVVVVVVCRPCLVKKVAEKRMPNARHQPVVDH
jgi:hypothetical protein